MSKHRQAFSITGRLNSIRHALSGLAEMLKSQHNARIHLLATTGVVLAAYFFKVSVSQWCLLVLVMMAVWVCEAFNTAIEYLCDVASPDFHPLIKKSKDIAAGAVLISAIGASIIGLIIFTPYFLVLFSRPML